MERWIVFAVIDTPITTPIYNGRRLFCAYVHPGFQALRKFIGRKCIDCMMPYFALPHMKGLELKRKYVK